MTQSINELKSYTEYNVSTPTSVFTIGFQYEYNVDHVIVYVDDVEATAAGYTVQHDSQGTVTLTPAVPSGVVRVSRETDIDTPAHTFSAGAKFTAGNMDENFTQLRHSQQEVRDGFEKLSEDTYEIIDTLQVVGQAAQDAADAAEQVKEYTNDKTISPITFLEKRNNVTVDLSFEESSNVLWRLLKDISVLNANSYEYYRISYMGVTKADGDLYNIHFQLDSVLRKDVETLDTRSLIGDVIVQSRSGVGDVVFTVNASPSNIQLMVTIDTDKIEQSNGSSIALWGNNHMGYCYIINPDRYVINDKQSISVSRNTIGSGEPITESTAYHIDPRTNVQTMIGSPFSIGYRNALVSNVRAQSEFVFPQFIETGGTILAFDQSSNHIEIPISRMTTRAEDSDTIVQSFTPAQISVHGIRKFTVRSPRPTYSRLIGSIELLVKLPAEDTVEDYRLTLQASPMIGYNSSANSTLGYSSSLEAREIQTINSLNIVGSNILGYYDQELLDTWLSGKWVKLSIPINGDVALFDGIGYRFMLWIIHVSGTRRTDSNVGNASCIILNGSATLNHDISPMLNHRYYHLLTGL